jgi:hypothetical protein
MPIETVNQALTSDVNGFERTGSLVIIASENLAAPAPSFCTSFNTRDDTPSLSNPDFLALRAWRPWAMAGVNALTEPYILVASAPLNGGVA